MLIRKHDNIRVYDVRSRVNVGALRTDFSRFAKTAPAANCELLGAGKLKLLSSSYKPFSSPFAEDMMMRSVLFMMESCMVDKINFQSCRLQSFPSVRDVKLMGIMCISRENCVGGMLNVNQFERELIPGELTVFDKSMDCNISQMTVQDVNTDGYLDVILFKDYNIGITQ